MTSTVREIIVALALTGLLVALPAPVRAQPDDMGGLALAICTAPNLEAIATALTTYELVYGLSPEQIAQAFGEAAFLCDLGRCEDPAAIAVAFANYKQGKDALALDAAFAIGQAGAEVESATASVAGGQSSFVALASPGDPPSGQ
ncbi:MAG: hypothetical protein ABL996_20175 [Micropepsaceae bacterium]